jgi:hypothetical protein
MEAFIGTLFETEWGLILLGIMIIIAIFINFFNNKPRI